MLWNRNECGKTKIPNGILKVPSAVQVMTDQKPLENMKCCNYLGRMITKDGRCTRDIKSKIVITKAAFQQKTLLTNQLPLNLSKKLWKCYILKTALCGAATWTLWKEDQKYLESFEMRCWRRMEKISWTDHVRNEEESKRREISYIQ